MMKENKEEVKSEQPIIQTSATTKPRIVLGSNVDNGKDVVFECVCTLYFTGAR